MNQQQLELYASLVRAQIRALGMQAYNYWAKQADANLYTEMDFQGILSSEGISEEEVRERSAN